VGSSGLAQTVISESVAWRASENSTGSPGKTSYEFYE